MSSVNKIVFLLIQEAYTFLNPPVLMNSGFWCIALHLYVTRSKFNKEKFISREPFRLGAPNLTWRLTLLVPWLCVKFKVIRQRSRSRSRSSCKKHDFQGLWSLHSVFDLWPRGQRSQGSRSKLTWFKVKGQGHFFQGLCIVYFTCDLEVKGHLGHETYGNTGLILLPLPLMRDVKMCQTWAGQLCNVSFCKAKSCSVSSKSPIVS